MVTIRIADLLLAVAARRWPEALRDELRQEWRAELHVLAADQRPGRMLGYAASLAITRPTRPAPAAIARAGWHAVRLVLVAPAITVALLLFALLAANGPIMVLSNRLHGPDTLGIMPVTVLAVMIAALIMLLGRRWTLPHAGIAPLVLAVTTPSLIMFVLFNEATNGATKARAYTLAQLMFSAVFGLFLVLAARQARSGHRRSASGWASSAP